MAAKMHVMIRKAIARRDRTHRPPSGHGGPGHAFPVTPADYNMGLNGGPSVVRRADVEAVIGPLAPGHDPLFDGEELDDD